MGKELHVVMLPGSGFGHLMPFFQLSVALAKAKVHVSYISTPRNIERLPKIPLELQPFIHFVSIPFPPLEPDFLPEGAEATVDIPFEKYENLMIAYDLLQTPVKQFIADEMPDWIIADFLPHWVVDIAKEYGVPLAFFSVFTTATCVFVAKEYEYEAIKRVNSTGMSFAMRLAIIISASQVLAIRTCNEIEGENLEVYKDITGKPVIPIGVLPPDQPAKRAKGEINSDESMFDWLDKQNSRSVVFVGFGSECKLTKEQVHEIAHGLELSELPFIWGLRKPNSSNTPNSDEVDDFLPLGFLDRTSERGLVCFGWVPQMEILGHPSIGGSLFHSGWGSAIETLQFGHCLVLLPFVFDQPANARFLVEKGLAAEVKRNEDGSFTKEDIAKTLRLAMVEDEGEPLRSNAKKATAVFGDHKLHQDHYIGAFVDYLKKNVTKK